MSMYANESIFNKTGKRSSEEICADILTVAKNGAKKSHIVYKVNLNFKIFNKYLNLLQNSYLISGPSKDKLFRTTKKGIEYLDHYRELQGLYQSRDRNIENVFR